MPGKPRSRKSAALSDSAKTLFRGYDYHQPDIKTTDFQLVGSPICCRSEHHCPFPANAKFLGEDITPE
jgi:hypothetical protein